MFIPYYYRPVLKRSILGAGEGRRIDMTVSHSYCLVSLNDGRLGRFHNRNTGPCRISLRPSQHQFAGGWNSGKYLIFTANSSPERLQVDFSVEQDVRGWRRQRPVQSGFLESRPATPFPRMPKCKESHVSINQVDRDQHSRSTAGAFTGIEIAD